MFEPSAEARVHSAAVAGVLREPHDPLLTESSGELVGAAVSRVVVDDAHVELHAFGGEDGGSTARRVLAILEVQYDREDRGRAHAFPCDTGEWVRPSSPESHAGLRGAR